MSTIKVNRIEAYSGVAVEVVGLQATASNALWAGLVGKPAGLVSGSYSSSMSTRITAQEDFSSSLDATFATDVELTSLSSSASTARDQIATDYIAADTSLSSSLATSITTLNNKTLVSSSVSGDLQGQVKVNGVNVNITDLQTNSNPTFANITGSNLIISNDLVVNGTASFSYLQSVTGSAKIIGDAFIVLNANSPTERYSGIQVYDSGSSDTGSLQYDSINNHWFYESTNEGYASGLIAGPTASKGNLTWPTDNTLVKSKNFNHIVDSNITDDGSLITLGSNTTITGTIVATGTALVSGSAQVAALLPSGVVSGSALSAQTASVNTTMVPSRAYVVTGTASPITMSLPSSPSVGDLIKFANMDDRATLIARGGSNIMSVAEDLTLDIEQVSFDLVYVGPTVGWTIYGSRALA